MTWVEVVGQAPMLQVGLQGSCCGPHGAICSAGRSLELGKGNAPRLRSALHATAARYGADVVGVRRGRML